MKKRGREGIQGCIGSCQVAKRPPWQLYGSLHCSPCKLPGPWGYLLFLCVSTHTLASSLPADGWCQATSVVHLHIPNRRRCMQQPFNQFQTNFYEQKDQCLPYSSHKWEIPHLFSEEELGYFSARIDKSQTNGCIACEKAHVTRQSTCYQLSMSQLLWNFFLKIARVLGYFSSFNHTTNTHTRWTRDPSYDLQVCKNMSFRFFQSLDMLPYIIT
jgi:hypothetical protein